MHVEVGFTNNDHDDTWTSKCESEFERDNNYFLNFTGPLNLCLSSASSSDVSEIILKIYDIIIIIIIIIKHILT